MMMVDDDMLSLLLGDLSPQHFAILAFQRRGHWQFSTLPGRPGKLENCQQLPAMDHVQK